MRKIVAAAFLASACVLSAASTFAEESPEALLKEMSRALKNLNYEGSFVHVQNGNVEAMRIVHSSDGEGELERMLSLNGEAREVFRNHSMVTCIWPDSNSVIVSDSKSRKMLPKISGALGKSDLYEIAMAKPDRVAGLHTHVIDIKPRDAFRYGYKIWVDKQTSMLLRSMLLDHDNNPIEQIMFTSISYPETIDPSRFELSDDYKQLTLANYPKPDKPDEIHNKVSFTQLPAGYEKVSETYRPMPIDDGPISHVLLSDGMASVSVYVEYVKQSDQKDIGAGPSSMGGMNAYMYSLPTAVITAVGEVPAATVESIAMSVALSE